MPPGTADVDTPPSPFRRPEMERLFAPDAHVQQMLAFEGALARAQAHVGVIPPEAAAAITAACASATFDVAALHRDAVSAGTLAIPLVRALTAHVGPAGSAYVHWGATSQDVIDTALMLEMRAGLDLLEHDLGQLAAVCAGLAATHRRTVMPGRTLLQQATPITFGLKAARWLSVAVRQIAAVRAQRASGLALQFGGATGTLASLGDRGSAVARVLADHLDLPLPALPWHGERDRVATIAATLGIVAGSVAKIATDVTLLAQTEVGEVAEAAAPGKGTSSAMPHKRNPVDATGALAAARLCLGSVSVVLSALPQEHERAAGGWQAEWVAVPDVFAFASGVVWHVLGAVTGLEVHADRMRHNLDMDGGVLMAESLSMALAPTTGRTNALLLVRELTARAHAHNQSLRVAAHADPRVRGVLSPDAIDHALDPGSYLGSADAFIDAALASRRALISSLE